MTKFAGLLFAVFITLFPALGQGSPEKMPEPTEQNDEDDNKWWKIREKRTDIYYPHNAHMDVMEQEGDSCMLCHPYT